MTDGTSAHNMPFQAASEIKTKKSLLRSLGLKAPPERFTENVLEFCEFVSRYTAADHMAKGGGPYLNCRKRWLCDEDSCAHVELRPL